MINKDYKPYYWWLYDVAEHHLTEDMDDFTPYQIEALRYIVNRTWGWGKNSEILTNSSFINGHKYVINGEVKFWFIRPVQMGRTRLKESIKYLKNNGIIIVNEVKTSYNKGGLARKFSLTTKFIKMIENRKDKKREILKISRKIKVKNNNKLKVSRTCKESEGGSPRDPLNTTSSSIDIDNKKSIDFTSAHTNTSGIADSKNTESLLSLHLESLNSTRIPEITKKTKRTKRTPPSVRQKPQPENTKPTLPSVREKLESKKQTPLKQIIEISEKKNINKLEDKCKDINTFPTLKNVQAKWTLSILESEDFKGMPIEKISSKEMGIFLANFKANPSTLDLSKIIDRAIQEWAGILGNSYIGKRRPALPSFIFFAYNYKKFVKLEYGIIETNFKNILPKNVEEDTEKVLGLQKEINKRDNKIIKLEYEIAMLKSEVSEEVDSRVDTVLKKLYEIMDIKSKPKMLASNTYARGELAPSLPENIDWDDSPKGEEEYQRVKSLNMEFKNILSKLFV